MVSAQDSHAPNAGFPGSSSGEPDTLPHSTYKNIHIIREWAVSVHVREGG